MPTKSRNVNIDVEACCERLKQLKKSLINEGKAEERRYTECFVEPYAKRLTEYEARIILSKLREGQSLGRIFKPDGSLNRQWTTGRWSNFSRCDWMDGRDNEWGHLHDPMNPVFETEEIQLNKLTLIYNLRKACNEWIEEFWTLWIEEDEHPWPWSCDPNPYSWCGRHRIKMIQLAQLPEGWTSDTNWDEEDFTLSSKETIELLGISKKTLVEWRKWKEADDEGVSGYSNTLPFTRTGKSRTTSCIYSLNEIEKWLEDPHPREKPDYLYLMTNESMPDMVKVGRSVNVEKRRKSMSSKSHIPTPFEIAWSLPYIPRFNLEKAVHKQLNGYRANPSREFFYVNEELTIDTILETAKQIANENGCRCD